MLRTAQLTKLRSAMSASLPDTATLQSYTPASDDQGGETRTWATASTVACRLNRSMRMVELEQGGKTTAVSAFELIVPYNATIRPRDRAVIGGTTYEVIETDGGGSERIEKVALVYRVT